MNQTSRTLPIQRTRDQIPEVTPKQVALGLGAFRLVDIREAEELVPPLGQLPGAEHVPMDRVEDAARAWSRHQPVVLYCRSGRRSGIAARRLEAMGFEEVASMRGGVLAWQDSALSG